MLRIGLVLGAGGSLGVAFHGGVLAAVAELTGWDPRRAEIVVGTSAGSLSGALLRSGLGAGDLRQVSEGRALSPEGADLADLGQPHRPRVRTSDFFRLRPPGDARAVLDGLVRPWRRSPLSLVAAALPEGPVGTAAISEGLDRAAEDQWPAGKLWVVAVRLGDGQRVVFGRDGSPVASLGRAVAASCAIPGYFRPVRIGADRYVDGGVASVHNLDLLAGLGLDLVVASAPMSFVGGRVPLGPDGVLRSAVAWQLGREVAALRRGGTPVVVLGPNPRVRGAMGLDPMNARNRGIVSRLAYRSTLDHLRRSGLGPLWPSSPGPSAPGVSEGAPLRPPA